MDIKKMAMMLVPIATLVLVYMVYQKACKVDENTTAPSVDDPNKK